MGTMSPERWQQVEAVLDGALDLPEAERHAYLSRACGSDAALRAEVEALIAACERPSRVPDHPAVVFAAPLLGGATGPADQSLSALAAGAEPAPPRIGAYRVVREAGRGGMGTVYVAERADGQFEQRVALKLMRRGIAGDAKLVRRFSTSGSSSPASITPTSRASSTAASPPTATRTSCWSSSTARPIDRYCDDERLPWSAAGAIRAGVRRGRVRARPAHRAPRPQAVERPRDRRRRVKLLDFGIAKLVAPDYTSDDGVDASITRPGERCSRPSTRAPSSSAASR
jgi:serine/threonine protein kinase